MSRPTNAALQADGIDPGLYNSCRDMLAGEGLANTQMWLADVRDGFVVLPNCMEKEALLRAGQRAVQDYFDLLLPR